MLRDHIKQNSLSIISLVVALSALSYNTWRNELTEENRNIRAAGFEVLVHLSNLQRIAYLAHYDKDRQNGNPRSGWTEVLVLRDFCNLMPAPLPASADALFIAWRDNWADLETDEYAVAIIDNAINDMRKEVNIALTKLK
jgi:hypothetical protein